MTMTKDAQQKAIRELLPWYANDSLDPDEKALVETHLASCDSCRDELAEINRFADGLAKSDDLDYAEDIGWSSLKERIGLDIEAEPVAVRASNTEPSIIDRAREWLSGLAGGWQWSAAGLAAACIALLVVVGNVGQQDTSYQTLTSDEAATLPVLRVRIADAVSEADLRSLLISENLEIVAGPSETGVYTLRTTSDEDLADGLADLAARLTDAEEIAFVSIKTGR